MKISFREYESPKDCDFFVCVFFILFYFILLIKFERIESDKVRVKLGLRAKHPLPTPPPPEAIDSGPHDPLV